MCFLVVKDAKKIRISIHETEYIFGRGDDASGGEASTGAVFPRCHERRILPVPPGSHVAINQADSDFAAQPTTAL